MNSLNSDVIIYDPMEKHPHEVIRGGTDAEVNDGPSRIYMSFDFEYLFDKHIDQQLSTFSQGKELAHLERLGASILAIETHDHLDTVGREIRDLKHEVPEEYRACLKEKRSNQFRHNENTYAYRSFQHVHSYLVQIANTLNVPQSKMKRLAVLLGLRQLGDDHDKMDAIDEEIDELVRHLHQWRNVYALLAVDHDTVVRSLEDMLG